MTNTHPQGDSSTQSEPDLAEQARELAGRLFDLAHEDPLAFSDDEARERMERELLSVLTEARAERDELRRQKETHRENWERLRLERDELKRQLARATKTPQAGLTTRD